MAEVRWRELGKTGLRVTPLGLGLAALGRPGYINLHHAEDLAGDYDAAVMERRAHAALDAAWEGGVRYFDAARSYGRAESFLASWLEARERTPADAAIGSKWGYVYTAGWSAQAERHEIKDHTFATLEQQHAESRALLGDHLDLYQIHSATLESGVLERGDVLARLAELRLAGLRIGVTLSGPRQAATLEAAFAVRVDGEPLFDCVQATWNLLEPSVGPALQAVHDAGWGVIVKEALANGRLTPRNSSPQTRSLLRLLQQDGFSEDAVALAAALAQPWVDVVLSGAATVEQVGSNLRALAVDPQSIPFDELAKSRETPEAYWERRSALAWN